MIRSKKYGDQRQGSRANANREPVESSRHREREPASRARADERDRHADRHGRDATNRHTEGTTDKLDRHRHRSSRDLDANGRSHEMLQDAAKSDRSAVAQHASSSMSHNTALISTLLSLSFSVTPIVADMAVILPENKVESPMFCCKITQHPKQPLQSRGWQLTETPCTVTS